MGPIPAARGRGNFSVSLCSLNFVIVILISFFKVVGNLLKKPQAKVVVLFTRAEDAR